MNLEEALYLSDTGDRIDGDPLVVLANEVRTLRERLAYATNPNALHAYCVRHLTNEQIAHLFGERMTTIVNEAEATRKDKELLDWANENLVKAEKDGKLWDITYQGKPPGHCGYRAVTGTTLREALEVGKKGAA